MPPFLFQVVDRRWCSTEEKHQPPNQIFKLSDQQVTGKTFRASRGFLRYLWICVLSLDQCQGLVRHRGTKHNSSNWKIDRNACVCMSCHRRRCTPVKLTGSSLVENWMVLDPKDDTAIFGKGFREILRTFLWEVTFNNAEDK